MTTQNIFNLVDTWALSGGPYTSIKMDATDNDSASASLLMDLQVGGVSQFNVSKAGFVSVALNGGLLGSGNVYLGGVSTNIFLGVSSGNNSVFNIQTGGSNAITCRSTSSFGWTSSTTSANGVADLLLTRRAAANLRFGAADAAAPVAQTLSVQSVVAGTTNTAGTNLTITGAQGTGTGAGGSIIFQVAPLGSSGSAQNALATALTINSDKTVNIVGVQNYTNDVKLGSSGIVGVGSYTNNTFFIDINGEKVLNTYASGSDKRFSVNSNYWIGWGLNTADGTVKLFRDADNTLALRNGTAAQTFRVYNTYTSDTNYESGRLQWVSNEWRIGPETVGGSIRSMGLYSGNTRYQIIGSSFNQFDQPLYMNGANIATDTSTGFKIGTGATQKLGFWNATPIAQPTTAVAAATVAATGVGDVVAASTTFDGYTIPQIVKAMRNAGLIA